MAGATWIERLEAAPPPGALRVAVKDALDVRGVPTTVGCRTIADTAAPASEDARCLAGIRAAGAPIVGKANLHELCFGTSGINPWYGTPDNPIDEERVPGGSSSGSAVAVAIEEADIGVGTDTGGSVRIPAACCGVVGLKTTVGRIPLDGVWPLAPSLDTVGAIARDVEGVVVAMRLLDPDFAADADAAVRVGRLRPPGVHPVIDAAVDDALRTAELEVVDVELPGWHHADDAFTTILLAEAWQVDHELVTSGRLGDDVSARLLLGAEIGPDRLQRARAYQGNWVREVEELLREVEVLALPTLERFPPTIGEMRGGGALNALTCPFNLARLPALAVPVPVLRGAFPVASLQLVGPAGGEALLCATGGRVEVAVGPGLR